MNINSRLINEMQDKAYREAYVISQIRTGLPFQIRALRTSLNLSQEELALKADMSQPRISELERITGRMPNLDTLCRVAAGCDVALEVRFVPFSELINRSEDFNPEDFRVPPFSAEIAEAAISASAFALQTTIETQAGFAPSSAEYYKGFDVLETVQSESATGFVVGPPALTEKTVASRSRAVSTDQFDDFWITETLATLPQEEAA